MKVELFDLEEFFSDKYINVDNKLGLCGLSVITQNQMVSRTGIEVGSISKVASHLEIEGSIMHDIFGFDKRLYFGLNKMDLAHQKVLRETVVIRYINNSTGRTIIIYLPSEQNSINTNQMHAIEYLNEHIEQVVRVIRRPIKIMVNTRKESVVEINSLRYKILPFLENYVDDNFIQSAQDDNIIAQNEIVLTKKI